MRNVSVLLILGLLFLVSACGQSSSDHNLNLHHSAMPGELYYTPGGTAYMAPDAVREQDGWNDAMREIDLAVQPFRSSGPKFAIAHIHFHDMSDATPDERAEYVGGGVIEACYHADRLPHTFCLSEAVRDLVAAQNPTADPLLLDWLEVVASSWVGALYGLTERID